LGGGSVNETGVVGLGPQLQTAGQSWGTTKQCGGRSGSENKGIKLFS